jgi:hypothetical protein
MRRSSGAGVDLRKPTQPAQTAEQKLNTFTLPQAIISPFLRHSVSFSDAGRGPGTTYKLPVLRLLLIQTDNIVRKRRKSKKNEHW